MYKYDLITDSVYVREHSPVQHQFFQLVQVAGDVLQSHVRDPRAPRQVQAAELAQVLSDQLNTIIGDLGAARETERSQVWQAMDHVYHAMVGDLPARVKPQSVGGVALWRNCTFLIMSVSSKELLSLRKMKPKKLFGF